MSKVPLLCVSLHANETEKGNLTEYPLYFANAPPTPPFSHSSRNRIIMSFLSNLKRI